MPSTFKDILLLFLIISIILQIGLLYWVIEHAPVGALGWEEVSESDEYYGSTAPDPPYDLSPEDIELLKKRVDESGALKTSEDDFERIAALRNWTRSVCPVIERNEKLTNDPSDILDALERGEGMACGGLASLYCAALLAHAVGDPVSARRCRRGCRSLRNRR